MCLEGKERYGRTLFKSLFVSFTETCLLMLSQKSLFVFRDSWKNLEYRFLISLRS